ncbi:MAG: YlxR family protein [Pseudomonadota bacterium]|jgi:predicted RNA-binding protein YlxR (DUF448 family)
MSERTCCVCRSKGDKWSFARLVCFEGALVWDEAWRAPGRGAYVHLSEVCLTKMSQVGRWERALRLAPGTLDVDQVRSLALSLLRRVGSALTPEVSALSRRGRN